MIECEKCGKKAVNPIDDSDVGFIKECNMACGLTALLCIQCSRDWLLYLSEQKINFEYSEKLFKVDAYKILISSLGDQPDFSQHQFIEVMNQGLTVVRECDEVENNIRKTAESWLAQRVDDIFND